MRRPLAQTLVTLTFITVAAEALIYPSENSVPNGLFSVSIGSSNIRLVDILIFGVFLSNLGRAKITSRHAWIYLLFMASSVLYLSLMADLGLSRGVGVGTIVTESRFLLYIVLLTPLIRSTTGVQIMQAGATALKVMAAPLLVAGAISRVNSIGIPVPGFPNSQFGNLGGDIGTIVGVLALCVVGRALEKKRASWAALWLFYPLLGSQRASIIATSFVGIIAIAILWHRRDLLPIVVRSRMYVAGILVGCGTTFLLGTVVLLNGRLPISDNLTNGLTQTFTSQGKLASADTRFMEIAYAERLFRDQPLRGQGLGVNVQFYDIFHHEFQVTESAHNYIADVLIRGGLAGATLALGLFLSAFVGPRPWTGTKWIWTIALMSLLGKGLMEPAFDKYRLAFFLAITLTSILGSSSPRGTTLPDAQELFAVQSERERPSHAIRH